MRKLGYFMWFDIFFKSIFQLNSVQNVYYVFQFLFTFTPFNICKIITSRVRGSRPDLKALMTAENDDRQIVQAQTKSLPTSQGLDQPFSYDSQKQFCLDFYRPYYHRYSVLKRICMI